MTYRGPNAQWFLISVVAFLLWGLSGLIIWVSINIIIGTSCYLYFKYKHYPIITSLLDSDLYKFTMQQVVLHQFPEAYAVYRFINRGKTEFPEGFAKALKREIKALSKIQLGLHELDWLTLGSFGFKVDYLWWLFHYKFNPEQVNIEQKGGDLEITIEGPWVETILWEVPLMAIISELYFGLTGKTYDTYAFMEHSEDKAQQLFKNDVKWSDFGTRRRFSWNSQNQLNVVMNHYRKAGYLGTSNPHFAMKYNLKPIGTYGHETDMAMQAAYSVIESNEKWMECWLKEYHEYPNLLIALTDTLTTDVFLRSFNRDLATKYTGVRQDSGNPETFAVKMIEHYKKLGINPKEKKIVFSDSLDPHKACELQKKFGDQIECLMGIGTNLSNDCGHKPLNMVIKLIGIDFGNGLKHVVKLSDNDGKHTGDLDTIQNVKKELGI